MICYTPSLWQPGVSGLTGERAGALGSVPGGPGTRDGRGTPGANLSPLAALLRAPGTEGHASKSPGKASALVVKSHRASGRGREEEGRAVPVVCPQKTMTFLLWYVNEALRPGPDWLQLCSTQWSQPPPQLWLSAQKGVGAGPEKRQGMADVVTCSISIPPLPHTIRILILFSSVTVSWQKVTTSDAL